MRIKISDLRIGKIKYDILFLNSYLLENGKENRKITNGPHYKLLEEYEKNPSLDLRQTDYFKFAKAHMDYFGSWFKHKGEEGIVEFMKRFLDLYNNIKNNGYHNSNGKLIVFKTVINQKSVDKYDRPHQPTETYVPEDYEIYDGHHRAAILAKVGYEYADVEFYSKFTLFKNSALKFVRKIRQYFLLK